MRACASGEGGREGAWGEYLFSKREGPGTKKRALPFRTIPGPRRARRATRTRRGGTKRAGDSQSGASRFPQKRNRIEEVAPYYGREAFEDERDDQREGVLSVFAPELGQNWARNGESTFAKGIDKHEEWEKV